jgi:hypothetical protein
VGRSERAADTLSKWGSASDAIPDSPLLELDAALACAFACPDPNLGLAPDHPLSPTFPGRVVGTCGTAAEMVDVRETAAETVGARETAAEAVGACETAAEVVGV